MTILKALRRQFRSYGVKYIEKPEVFSYRSFYSPPWKRYNLIPVEGTILADYWYSSEDRFMGKVDGRIAVESKNAHDNAKAVIAKLTGASSVRFHTDSP